MALARASWYEVIDAASGLSGLRGFKCCERIGGCGVSGVIGGVILNRCGRNLGLGKTSASHQVSATRLRDFFGRNFPKDDLKFGVEVTDLSC
jgi:hypothetical protein